jgi:hypothetical protein
MAGGWYAMNSLSSLSNALALLTALGPPSQSPSSDTRPSSKTSTSASSDPLSFGQVSAGSVATTLVNNTLGQGANSSSSPNDLFVGQVSQNSVTTLVEVNGLDQGSDSYAAAYAPFFQSQAQLYQRENSLTSQQISNALYSGTGLQMGGGIANDTFADEISSLENDAASASNVASTVSQWVAQGLPTNNASPTDTPGYYGDTVAQANTLIAEENSTAASDTNLAGSLLTAFNNHTLTFEKATDVQGLDYSATVTQEQDGSADSMSGSNSYNNSFLAQDADGKQHALAQFGDVMLYLSW